MYVYKLYVNLIGINNFCVWQYMNLVSHQLKDVIGHWMDTINWEGWLPREQILGEEAKSKVPEVQRDHVIY